MPPKTSAGAAGHTGNPQLPPPPTPPPFITVKSPKYLAFCDKLEDADKLLRDLGNIADLRVWPGIYKRDKGQDSGEDDEDVAVRAAGSAGVNAESDAETSDDAESDTKKSQDFLDNDFWDQLYIPYWTDPTHRDVRRVKVTDIDTEPSNKQQNILRTIRARLDLPQLLNRPALLPKDAARKPTLYAKRYGINPDGSALSTSQARSRFSPTISPSRRVPVVDPNTGQETGATVDQDQVLLEARRYAHGLAALFSRFDTIQANDPDYLRYMAMKKLIRMSSDDVDYQRAMFNDLSTDERILLQNADPEDPNPPQDCDLRGPLHSMLEYSHWKNTIKWANQDAVDAYTTLNYDLEGTKGVYGVKTEDQRLWMALQPSLQVASRILAAHPAFPILTDVFSRRLAPEELINNELIKTNDPKQTQPGVPPGWKRRARRALEWPVCIHVNSGDGVPMGDLDAQEAYEKWLEETEYVYDVSEEIWKFMEDGIRYQLGLAIDSTDKTDQAGLLPIYAFTKSSKLARPQISISVRGIWPLLVPSFTHAEKGIAAKTVASTLLHELGHAFEYSARGLVSNHWLRKQKNLSRRAMEAMKRLRWEILVPQENKVQDEPEPHWGMEANAELGFAIENQLWSGTPSPALASAYFSAGDAMFMDMLAPSLQHWPTDYWPMDPEKFVRKDEEDTLLAPRPPIHDFRRLTTAAEETKVFQQTFWDAEVAKRGTKALWPTTADGGPLPTVRARIDPPTSVTDTLIDPKAKAKIDIALYKLRRAGFWFSSLFLTEWMNEIGQTQVVSTQWKHFIAKDTEWRRFINHLVIPYVARMRAVVAVLQVEQAQSPTDNDFHKVNAMQVGLVGISDPDVQAPNNRREYRNLVKWASTQVFRAVRETGPLILNRAVVHLSEVQALIIHHLAQRKPDRDRRTNSILGNLRQNESHFVKNIRELIRQYRSADTAIRGILNIAYRSPQLDTDADYGRFLELNGDMCNKMDLAVNRIKDAFDRLERSPQQDQMQEGVPTVQTFDTFTSVPNRRFRRRKQTLKKQAMQEVYKMPKRLRDVFEHLVYVIGHVAAGVRTRDNNPEVDIEQELMHELRRAKRRLTPRGPLEEPIIPVNRYMEIGNDVKRPQPPEPVCNYLRPALHNRPLAPGRRPARPGSHPQIPGSPAQPNNDKINKILPPDVSREWIQRLWGGREVLQQIENSAHPYPWVFKDKTNAKLRRERLMESRPWTPEPSSEEDRSDISKSPPLSPYQSPSPMDADSEFEQDSASDSDSDVGMTGTGSGNTPPPGATQPGFPPTQPAAQPYTPIRHSTAPPGLGPGYYTPVAPPTVSPITPVAPGAAPPFNPITPPPGQTDSSGDSYMEGTTP